MKSNSMNNPMSRLSMLLFFAAIFDIAVISDFINGKVDYLIVIIAIGVTTMAAYNLLSLKYDGLLVFMGEEDKSDERMRRIWNKARSNGFYVLFFCTWFTAMIIHDGRYKFLLPNMGLYLASISILGFLVVIISVIWLKYKV